MTDAGQFTIKEDEADLSAPSFAVLINEGRCWKCAEQTSMAAIWVPSYTEIDHEEGEHLVSQDAAVLQYVGGLTEEVQRQVLAAAPWLRYAHTEGAGATLPGQPLPAVRDGPGRLVCVRGRRSILPPDDR